MARDSSYALNTASAGKSADAYAELSNYPWASGDTTMTVCGWVNQGSGFANKEGIWGNWHTAAGGKHLVRNAGSGGVIEAYVNTTSGQKGISLTGTMSANTWHFWALVCDGSNAYLWRDQDKSTGASYTGTFLTPATYEPRIGVSYSSASQGSIDAWHRDYAFWKDVALPDETIKSLAAGMNPLAAGPTHYWPLDNTLRDLVGANHFTHGANSAFESSYTGSYSYLPLPIGAAQIQVPGVGGGGDPVPTNQVVMMS